MSQVTAIKASNEDTVLITTGAATLSDEKFKRICAETAKAYGIDPNVFFRLLEITGAQTPGEVPSAAGGFTVRGIHEGILSGTAKAEWGGEDAALPYTKDDILNSPELGIVCAAMHLSNLQKQAQGDLKTAIEIYLGTLATPENVDYVMTGKKTVTALNSPVESFSVDNPPPKKDDPPPKKDDPPPKKDDPPPKTNSGNSSGILKGFTPAPSNSGGDASAVTKWRADAENAANIVGYDQIDANLLLAMVWCESGGNQGTNTQNAGGGQDLGLMQIGKQRITDRLTDLKATNPAKYDEINRKFQAQFGKDISQIDVTNGPENLVAGAVHLMMWTEQNGGNILNGLAGYVLGKPQATDRPYPKNVMQAYSELQSGASTLSRDAWGTQTAEMNYAELKGG